MWVLHYLYDLCINKANLNQEPVHKFDNMCVCLCRNFTCKNYISPTWMRYIKVVELLTSCLCLDIIYVSFTSLIYLFVSSVAHSLGRSTTWIWKIITSKTWRCVLYRWAGCFHPPALYCVCLWYQICSLTGQNHLLYHVWQQKNFGL